jgi:signal transduction histidine kinase
MELRTSLMLRLTAAALACLVAVVAAVAWHADRARRDMLEQRADQLAAQLTKQWTAQMLLRSARRHAFGDPALLLEGVARPGQCAALHDTQGDVTQRHCVGSDIGESEAAPAWFAELVAPRALAASQRVVVDGVERGTVVVEDEPRQAAAAAWQRIAPLVALSTATLAALWLLVHVAMARALRPLDQLVAALARLAHESPGARLDAAGGKEFCRIAEAFNQLAATLERRTAERDALTRRLVGLQEEERRHLARELHDEFGQCMAAINALAASIACSSGDSPAGVADEARRIQRLVEPMMRSLRAMLLRLQPPGLEELGLESCLRSLVADWNARSATRFELDVTGPLQALSRPVAVNLYRVVQESLTNAVKHAAASTVRVRVTLAPPDDAIRVTVEDDGQAAASTSSRPASGFGISGMRERVAALGGRLEAGLREPQGFVVDAWIPLAAS